MTLVRRAVTRRTVASGVYRVPISVTRRWLIPVPAQLRTITPGAGEVLIQSIRAAVMPLFPRAGEVLINGSAATISTTGRIVSPGAGEVLIVGNAPAVYSPGIVLVVLNNAIRRRRFAARYSSNYPSPPYDVLTRTLLQPPYGRLVQIGAGDVQIIGGQATLLVNAVHRAGAGAGEVLIEGAAPFAFWSRDLAAGASVVLITGYPALITNVSTTVSAGSSVVDIVGYNPGIEIVIGWSEMGVGSATWSASTTVVGSWSDVVVTTSIWTRQ